jgi:hypothetical protein
MTDNRPVSDHHPIRRNAVHRMRAIAAALSRAGSSTVAAIRRRPGAAVALAVLATFGFLWLLLGPVTVWATPVDGLAGRDLADVRTATHQVLLAALGGLAVLTGLAFTARTYYLTRPGAVQRPIRQGNRPAGLGQAHRTPRRHLRGRAPHDRVRHGRPTRTVHNRYEARARIATRATLSSQLAVPWAPLRRGGGGR